MKFRLEGVIPAIVTPFTKNGKEIDYDKACALAVRLADAGMYGIFVAGTTGEGLLMTLPERKRLLEELVGVVGKRLKVVAHAGCLDTASTIELACHAKQAGASAAGIIAPGFYTYDDACLYNHYKAVSKAAKGFPLMLYNLPGCAKNALSPDLTLRLAHDFDNIVGIKDSSGVIHNVTSVIDGAPKGFSIINGVDEYTFEALVSGANGAVSSTMNVIPEVFLAIYQNVKKGNLKKARTIQKTLTAACGAFQYGRMVALYKEGLRLRGFDPGYVRPPQRECTAAERKTLATKLAGLGLI